MVCVTIVKMQYELSQVLPYLVWCHYTSRKDRVSEVEVLCVGFQIRICVSYGFAHQLCLSPLVKIEFRPHYRNSFFYIYTGISLVVLKAACHVTVHKMLWYCSCTIENCV